MNKIQGSIRPTEAWFKNFYGIESTNPFITDLDEIAEKNAKKSRVLYERYPDLPLGEKNPVPKYFVQGHSPGIVCATSYGASYPIWDPDMGCFWPVEEKPVWSDIKTVADVEKIKAPNWEENPLIQEMLQRYEELQCRTKYDTEQMLLNEWPWKNPNTGDEYRFWLFISFIDLGGYLLGNTEFITLLALEHELAHALMLKCFEISVSYSEFLQKTFNRDLTAYANLGGDNSCLYSPEMYREYGMAFDEMLIEKYGELPCNLHSCGPSPHLYDLWPEYSNYENIVIMQTRALPDEIGRLRKALPNTYLTMYMFAPQIDLENEDIERVREIVWKFAEGAEFRDLMLFSYINKACDKTDENVRAFYRAIDEVNQHIESDAERTAQKN